MEIQNDFLEVTAELGLEEWVGGCQMERWGAAGKRDLGMCFSREF